jgi:hypothetical protein
MAKTANRRKGAKIISRTLVTLASRRVFGTSALGSGMVECDTWTNSPFGADSGRHKDGAVKFALQFQHVEAAGSSRGAEQFGQ